MRSRSCARAARPLRANLAGISYEQEALEHRDSRPSDRAIGDIIAEPPFLNQRDKERTGAGDDPKILVHRTQGGFVGATLDRGSRADHANMTIFCRARSRSGSGLDYADYGDTQLLL